MSDEPSECELMGHREEEYRGDGLWWCHYCGAEWFEDEAEERPE